MKGETPTRPLQRQDERKDTRLPHAKTDMKILLITTSLPHRLRNGGEIATQAFVDALKQAGHKVTLLGYRRPGDGASAPDDYHAARAWPIETELAPVRRWVWLARALLTGAPYVCVKFRTRALIRAARALCLERSFDLVLIDHLQLGWIADAPFLPARRIGIAHNVEHRILEVQAQEPGNGRLKRQTFARDSVLMKKVEADMLRSLEQLWVLTDEERDLMAALEPGATQKIRVMPLAGQRFAAVPALPDPTIDVAILGSWLWDVNRKGLEWFMGEVAPLLPASMRVVVGGKGSEHVPNSSGNVVYAGFVDDAAEFLRSAKVICVPSVIGAGIQLKTIEGIGIGRPMVSTRVGTRGIGDLPPHVHVVEDAAAMAEALRKRVDEDALDASAAAWRWSEDRQASFLRRIGESVSAPNAG